MILFGQGPGYEDVVREEKLIHYPDVETNEKGTPLVSSMYAIAEERGRHRLMAYANCDMIFASDLAEAAARVPMDRFLMIGQRWNILVDREIDFDRPGWHRELLQKAQSKGELSSPWAIDYFLFTKNVWRNLPEMAVGRGGYDNWLIYYCRKQGVPVVDASDVVAAIHQRHDYSHISGGRNEVFRGAEASRNRALGGGRDHLFNIVDAEFRLGPEGISKNYHRRQWGRLLEAYLILNKETGFNRQLLSLFRFYRSIYRSVREYI